MIFLLSMSAFVASIAALILDRQYIGRAMTDFERMGAQFEINDNGDEAVIKGAGPVATVGNYQAEVNAYTRGKGVL